MSHVMILPALFVIECVTICRTAREQNFDSADEKENSGYSSSVT